MSRTANVTALILWIIPGIILAGAWCFRVQFLSPLQDDLDVRLRHRLPQIAVHDVTATAIENAAQVVERPADVDVRTGGQQVTGYRTVEAPRLARHYDCLSLILSRWRYDLAMAKPTYNADGARRYREKRAAHIALLVKSAQRAGILDEINQQADQLRNCGCGRRS